MVLAQRGLFIASVIAIVLSGLGYDPLSRLIPVLAPYALPALSLVALIYVHMTSTLRRDQQQQLAVDRLTQEYLAERHSLAGRLNQLETANAQLTTQLITMTEGLQRLVSDQEILIPARVLLLQYRFDDVVKLLEEMAETSPTNVEARWLLGEALLGNRRYTEALPHLQAGLIETDVHRLTLVAQCEQTAGQYAKAEQHWLALIDLRGEVRQQDLVSLGAVQSELDPERASETLSRALELNPFNSAARYQLMDLKMRMGFYDESISLASEGLERNAADIGCFVSRAEALYRRGRDVDEKDILQDLTLAQTKNRRDYNIYRLRGELYQRQASRVKGEAKRNDALQLSIDAYEEGLSEVPGKFQAHLLAAESRVFLQLKRFDEAVKTAQRAVEHSSGHVSNHLALALARLASGQWRCATQAADQGLPWAGWGGRIWLTAIGIFASACSGVDPDALRQKCADLSSEIGSNGRRFELSETWSVVRDVLSDTCSKATDSGHALVRDTMALLEHAISPEDYRRMWGKQQDAHEVA